MNLGEKMRQIFTIISILLMLSFLISCGDDTSDNDGDNGNTDYFPLKIGNEWTFRESTDLSLYSYTIKLDRNAATKEKGGSEVYMVSSRIDTGNYEAETYGYSLTQNGLERVDYEDTLGEVYSSQYIMLKKPYDAGTTWETISESGNDTLVFTIVSTNETVNTVGGTFRNALKIEITNKNEISFKEYDYFAPNIGYVLFQFYIYEKLAEKRELRSYILK